MAIVIILKPCCLSCLLLFHEKSDTKRTTAATVRRWLCLTALLHRSRSLQQWTKAAMVVGHSYPVLNKWVPTSLHCCAQLRTTVSVVQTFASVFYSKHTSIELTSTTYTDSSQCTRLLSFSYVHCLAYAMTMTSVNLSVRPSVTLVNCDHTVAVQDNVDILIPHERHSAFSDTNSGWGRRFLSSEICTLSDPPPSKNADFDRFPLITSQP